MKQGARAPYTAHDTPEVVERIEGDLATILDAVREADPGLVSLVLTGGFARAEGAVLDGQPQNDYDLVAVRRSAALPVDLAPARRALEDQLGLHVDLARIGAWRLRWVPATIFWYETALRGRTLWGAELLDRIRVREPDALDPAEALRLLSNRAAGLLLGTRGDDAHAHRLQAAKALLAAGDAHLLSMGHFAPSQRERWDELRALRESGTVPRGLERHLDWMGWAMRFKLDSASGAERAPDKAWCAAREALLDALPAALELAGHARLDEATRTDGLVDHLVYAARARRLALHPSARVRVATLRLLDRTPVPDVSARAAHDCLGSIEAVGPEPLDTLETLRAQTLQ